MYTFTRSINYDLNLFDTRQRRTTFRNHDRFESLWKHKWLSKPSRLKVLIILKSKRILLLKLYSFNVPIFSFTYVILSCVRLILKIPKIFQIAFRFSIDRRRYRNDLSGLLERRRHDCKSFSPDLFSRSCIYIYTYVLSVLETNLRLVGQFPRRFLLSTCVYTMLARL